MSALAAPATWRRRPRRGGAGRGDAGAGAAAGRNGAAGAAGRAGAGVGPNGASTEEHAALVERDEAAGLDGAVVGFVELDRAAEDARDLAVRRSARTLHTACAELLPGYAEASREPWRQALLTAGCLDARPRPGAGRRQAPPLIVEDVVQPSDVLCALWLARRCGLFSPGSPCGDGVGLRSACEIVPAFADGVGEERRAEVLEVLRANTAWRAHRLARAAA
jgi:hypothetical protein